MKILQVAAEAYPWIKIGGLSDVVRALSEHLSQRGHHIILCIPLVRELKDKVQRSLGEPYRVILGNAESWARLQLLHDTGSFTVLGIEIPGETERTRLYHADHGDEELFHRFLYFTRAVIEAPILQAWAPQIVHLHDWHAAPVAIFARVEDFAPPESWRHCGILFTIHNLAFQGIMPLELAVRLGFPPRLFSDTRFIHQDKFNLLKGAISCADYITTVSPSYAREILTPQFGYGLQDWLVGLQPRMQGILNGIDTNTWNPWQDTHLTERYNAVRLSGKAKCRQYLIQKMGLDDNIQGPIFGAVARLTYQKGIDLLCEIMPFLVEKGGRCIVQGSGESQYASRLRTLMDTFPRRFTFFEGYNEDLAHQIEAGLDIYLMPSRFEPCGLNQLYSLRYGTIPVVARTGGLRDTIVDVRHDPDRGTGFLFRPGDLEDFRQTINDTLVFYRDHQMWHTLIRRCMGQDFSWKTTVERYELLYTQILGGFGHE